LLRLVPIPSCMGNGIASQRDVAAARSGMQAKADATSTPGKATLVGDAGIDSEGMGACLQRGSAGCFLTPGARRMLIMDMQGRMHSAQGAYRDALIDCRLAQVLKKTDELPWYCMILLGAASSVLESAVSAGVKVLRASKEAAADALAKATGSTATAVSDMTAREISNRVTLQSEVTLVSEKQIDALIATSVEIVKEKSTAALTGVVSTDSKETQEKNLALAYIDYLRDQCAAVFQELREGPPGRATDAELLALWRSFDEKLQSTAMYRAQVDEAIEHYLHCNVSKMGRSREWDDEHRDLVGNAKRVEREVRVAWLETKGAGKRLVYMDRVFDDWYLDRQDRGDHCVQRSTAYDADENRLSLSQPSSWTIDGAARQRADKPLRDDRVLNFVEQEFVEMALKKQEKIWLEPPATFVEDWDHQVAIGVPRIVKVAP
jgi:hypothetical protein